MLSKKFLLSLALLFLAALLHPIAAVSNSLLLSLPPSSSPSSLLTHRTRNLHQGLAFCPTFKDNHSSRWLVASEENVKPLSTAEKVKKYFDDRGIVLMDLPKTILIYELTSAGLMFGIWGVCFLLQPMKRGMALANMVKPGTFEVALQKGEKVVSRGGKRAAGMRLVTAYAEGAVLRTALKPLIIPLKLFLTWQLSAVTTFFGRGPKSEDKK